MQSALRGATETNSINALVQSGRHRSVSKRSRVGPARIGLAMFQHPKVDDYEKRPFADSDISLFTAQEPPRFFGFVALDEDPTRNDAFITAAVAGRVNVLNTSIWPIEAFDRICVCIQKRGTKMAWLETYFNADLAQVTECALVCPEHYIIADEYKKYFEDNYDVTPVGFALTNERCKGSASTSHLFSLHMDKFAAA